MASFDRELENSLKRALTIAAKRGHEFATLEHLLLALCDDAHAQQVMLGCGLDVPALQTNIDEFFCFLKIIIIVFIFPYFN